jgi:phage virion morphogenesis protein
MVALTFTLEDKGLGPSLERALALTDDLTPLMERIGAVLESSVNERFLTGIGPDGEAWTPSHRAREVGGATLVDSTRLRDNIETKAGQREVEIGSNVPYAATHQFGALIEPRDKTDAAAKLAFFLPNGQFIMVDQVEIPARPFLGIDARDEVEITEAAEAWFGALFQ